MIEVLTTHPEAEEQDLTGFGRYVGIFREIQSINTGLIDARERLKKMLREEEDPRIRIVLTFCLAQQQADPGEPNQNGFTLDMPENILGRLALLEEALRCPNQAVLRLNADENSIQILDGEMAFEDWTDGTEHFIQVGHQRLVMREVSAAICDAAEASKAEEIRLIVGTEAIEAYVTSLCQKANGRKDVIFLSVYEIVMLLAQRGITLDDEDHQIRDFIKNSLEPGKKFIIEKFRGEFVLTVCDKLLSKPITKEDRERANKKITTGILPVALMLGLGEELAEVTRNIEKPQIAIPNNSFIDEGKNIIKYTMRNPLVCLPKYLSETEHARLDYMRRTLLELIDAGNATSLLYEAA